MAKMWCFQCITMSIFLRSNALQHIGEAQVRQDNFQDSSSIPASWHTLAVLPRSHTLGDTLLGRNITPKAT